MKFIETTSFLRNLTGNVMADNYRRAKERLDELFGAFQGSIGEYLGQATRWHQKEWITEYNFGRDLKQQLTILRDRQQFVLSLSSEPLTRERVFDVFDRVADTTVSIVDAFIIAMAWGFRPRSYGPYRTSVMLSRVRTGEKVEAVLESAREVLSGSTADDGSVKGYQALQRKLERLGPAFATKFLYFASPIQCRAPILDAVVEGWLDEFDVTMSKGTAISAGQWNVSQYRAYVEFCRSVATDIGCNDVGIVEYLMFTDVRYGEYVEGGNFQPDWVKAVRRPTIEI